MTSLRVVSALAVTSIAAASILAAQTGGAFELRTGLAYRFSQVSYEQGSIAVSLSAGYREQLNRTLGVAFGLATTIGETSVASDLCFPLPGSSCGESTQQPGGIHFAEAELSIAPFGRDGAFRIGAGGVLAWAPGASGTSGTSMGPALRLEGLLPVRWRPRPTLGARMVLLGDRIGVVRWIGTATVGLSW